MSRPTIYHNPRCSKSRQTLALLQAQGVEPRVIEYLDEPLDRAGIERLLKQLGVEPIEMMRTKEVVFRELGLASKKGDRDALINAMVENPVLIERPIVVNGVHARIGRPPENVLEII